MIGCRQPNTFSSSPANGSSSFFFWGPNERRKKKKRKGKAKIMQHSLWCFFLETFANTVSSAKSTLSANLCGMRGGVATCQSAPLVSRVWTLLSLVPRTNNYMKKHQSMFFLVACLYSEQAPGSGNSFVIVVDPCYLSVFSPCRLHREPLREKKAEVNENLGLYLCRPCVLVETLSSLPFF